MLRFSAFYFVAIFTLLFIVFLPLQNKIFATSSTECTYLQIDDGSGGVQYSDPLVPLDENNYPACTSIDTGDLGFQIPSLGDILTFAIRAFFVIAGLAALFYLLLGALGWVTSGGDKDAVTAARDKIQAAVVGMILIVGVLAIIWTLEQVIFKRRICLGLSCPLTLPGLIETTAPVSIIGGFPRMQTKDANCCVCAKPDGSRGQAINTFLFRCKSDGNGEPF